MVGHLDHPSAVPHRGGLLADGSHIHISDHARGLPLVFLDAADNTDVLVLGRVLPAAKARLVTHSRVVHAAAPRHGDDARADDEWGSCARRLVGIMARGRLADLPADPSVDLASPSGQVTPGGGGRRTD